MKQKLEIGKEYPFKGEDQYIFTLVRDVQAELAKTYGPGDTKRKAHPKTHGLIRAEFIVEPNLRNDLKIGVFRHSKSYPCWIRYSNANSKIQPDIEKDVRGMAIKILNVEGHKLLTEQIHDKTQDFILVSQPVFPAKNARQFQHFLRITSGSKLKALLPQNWKFIPMMIRFMKLFVRPGNLLQIPFWSAVPYQFGDEARAVKYLVQPQAPYKDPVPKKPTDWYLRDALIRTLARGDVLLDFMVQFQEDPYTMPIERSGVEWKSEFIKLATIRIPKQKDFTSQERDSLGENLAFSPWHSLPEHRPLGSINRARRAVYHTLAAFRHRRNRVRVEVPVPHVENTIKHLETNLDRLKILVAAYRDKDMQLVTEMLSDDVVWRQPPFDHKEQVEILKDKISNLTEEEIKTHRQSLKSEVKDIWQDILSKSSKKSRMDDAALPQQLRKLSNDLRSGDKSSGHVPQEIRDLKAMELYRLPYAGIYSGKLEVMKFFYIQSKTIRSEFIQPTFIGEPDSDTLVLYGQEKVEITGDIKGEVVPQITDGHFKVDMSKAEFKPLNGNFETTFVLIVKFDSNGKVKEIDSLYDTEEVAENFAIARVANEVKS